MFHRGGGWLGEDGLRITVPKMWSLAHSNSIALELLRDAQSQAYDRPIQDQELWGWGGMQMVLMRV